MRRGLVCFVVLFLTGCSGGQASTHTAGTVMLKLQSAPPISIGVWDDRPDVINGDRDPAWIGLQRSLYGIPYGVQTSSRRPFAEELGKMLERSFRHAGLDVEMVHIPVGSDRQDAVEYLVATEHPRLLLLRIGQWYADTYVQTTLHYDVTLDVLDSRGSLVAQSALSGGDDLGRKMREGRRSTTEAIADILQTLLTRNQVKEAMASAEVIEEKDGCSVGQILAMRENGLSGAQIKAACGETS